MDCAEEYRRQETAVAIGSLDAGSDDLYRALDGLILHGTWRVHVASVVVDESYRWIQLDLLGPRRYSFLFRLTMSVNSMGVRHALQWWLAGEVDEERTKSGAVWDGIVAMHMVTEQPGRPDQPAEPKRSFHSLVESAVEAVHQSRRAVGRALWRM